MPLPSQPVIPLEIQMEVILLALSTPICPTTLMLVCKAWKTIVAPEIHRAQVACALCPQEVDSIVSHFNKSGSRPLFFCLVEEWRFNNQTDWDYIEQLSTAFFPRIRSLGLAAHQRLVQDLMSTYGSTTLKVGLCCHLNSLLSTLTNPL